MTPIGRAEIREWVYNHLREHPRLLDDVTADKLMLVLMSTHGWAWDIADVGKATVHAGTEYEQEAPFAGLIAFIDTCIKDYRK